MKRSEFAEIVNAISREEFGKLNDALQNAYKTGDNALSEMIAEIALSIPAIAARTTAETLIRSGLLQFEDD